MLIVTLTDKTPVLYSSCTPCMYVCHNKYLFISDIPWSVARVVKLEQDLNDTFTLVCVTTNSPPTNLLWAKDGIPMNMTGTSHKLTQTVIDRSRSTYKNVLEVDGSVDKLPGEYSCAVGNIFGISAKATITGKG